MENENFGSMQPSYQDQVAYLALALVFLSTLRMQLFGSKRSLERQRRLIRNFRNWLASYFGWSRMEAVRPDSVHAMQGPGWKVLPLSFVLMKGLLSVSLVYDGHLLGAMNACIIGFVFLLLTLLNVGHHLLVFCSRILFLHQLWVLFFVFDKEMNCLIVRRAIVIRAVTDILFFEAMEETAIHYVALSLLANTRYAGLPKWLPLQVFVGFVVPAEVLGFREWMCSRYWAEKSRYAEQLHRTVLLLLPSMMTILFAFGTPGGSAARLQGNGVGLSLFSYIVAALHLLLTIINLFFSETVDKHVMPSLIRVGSYSGARSQWIPRISNMRPSVLHFAARCLQMILAYQASSTITLLTLSAIIMVFLSREGRLFSSIQIECGLFRTMLVLITQRSEVKSVLVLMSLMEIAVSYLTCSARERSEYLVQLHASAQGDLDHLIKQKYSAIGCTLEQVLDTLTVLSPEAVGTMEQQQQRKNHTSIAFLLADCLRECRTRHDSCCLLSIAQAIRLKLYEPDTTSSIMSLADQIAIWHERQELQHILLVETVYSDLPLEMDWKLVRLLICDWSRLRPMTIRALPAANDCRRLVIRITRELMSAPDFKSDLSKDEFPSRSSHEFYSRIVEAMGGGKVTTHEIEVFGTVCSNVQDPVLSPLIGSPQSILSTTKVTEGFQSLPSNVLKGKFDEEDLVFPTGLTFAILDDNKLVRMNTLRLLKRAPIRSSPASFAIGESMDECHRFARLITELRVDVAIFDQNLDYLSDDGIAVRKLGAEVARIAKEVYGFNGLMVLHSANEALSDTFETCLFDGFIAKTSSKQVFIQGLLAAWECHNSRLNSSHSMVSCVQTCVS